MSFTITPFYKIVGARYEHVFGAKLFESQSQVVENSHHATPYLISSASIDDIPRYSRFHIDRSCDACDESLE